MNTFQSIIISTESRNLPQNHRQQVFPNGTLIVREVNKKADEGKYTCTAENKDGDRSQKDVYVQVMEERGGELIRSFHSQFNHIITIAFSPRSKPYV
ncbi:down syndrome cell adhesion molecule-like protein Dscam2 [Caerostris extrusa]|uniref:Down syndrome cell adhesion molecule-like protein Dscam2 n=1 Tax=Caerostris extrusa TaxID=172846 RepID=A0AAV4XJA6_CAEEX|nr:down syndrome cell adhesion molecule-like protein Dscam2 [Caerostris extrusa]